MLAVAFADVGVMTTIVKVLKNFIIVGDVTKGLSCFAFQVSFFKNGTLTFLSEYNRNFKQEEPYKLILLGKDWFSGEVTSADFMVYEGKMAFIVTNPQGTIRMLEFNPLRKSNSSVTLPIHQ